MTSKFLQAIPTAIQDALTNWSQREDSDLRGYLETLVSPEETETILNVLDRITAAEAELKKSGLPPRVWAGERLEKLASEILEDGPLGDLRGMEPVELGSHIIDLGLAGMTVFADNTIEQALTDLRTLAEDGLDAATRFFQSPLGDIEERSVIAIVTAGILNLARSLGEKLDVLNLTATIDLGLRAAKIAYHQAAGLLDSDEAFFALEDRIAAVAVAVADHLVDQLPDAGALVGQFLGTVLIKNPMLGAMAGRALGEMVAPVIRPMARQAADSLARKAVNWVKKEAVSQFEKIRSTVFG